MTTIASATPGAYRVPKADAAGKLLAGWFTAAVLLTDLGLGAGVAGDLVYGSGANTLARLGIGTAGRVLVAGASAPAWSDSGLSYASSILTIAGSVPGTPSSGQVAIGGGAIKAGGTITAASLTATGLTPGCVAVAGTGGLLGATSALIFDGTSLTAVRIVASGAVSAGTYAFDIVAGNSVDRSLARFGISGITNGFTIGFTQSTGALAYSFLGGTGSAGSATFAVPITFPNGTAAAPGIRTTTYAHGLHSIDSTAMGLDVAGALAVSLYQPGGAGTLTVSGGFIASLTSNVGSLYTGNMFRVVATPAESAVYRAWNGDLQESGTASTTHFNQALYQQLSILSSGSNAGYDRAGIFNVSHTGAGGTRAEETAVFAQTVASAGFTFGAITLARTFFGQILNSGAGAITTGVLLDLGPNAGATKYAIRSLSTSGIVSIGDTTTAGAASGAIVCSGGGYFAKAVFSNNDALGVHYYGNAGLTMRDVGTGTATYLDLAFGSATHGTYSIRSSNAATVRFSIDALGVVTVTNTTDATTTSDGGARLACGLSVAAGKSIIAGAKILSVGPTSGIGYGTGAGGTVTQGTSRTTGVTLHKVTGRIALFTAAGSATPTTFTVTCSACAETDTVVVTDWSGAANTYIWKAKAANGSFDVTFWTTGGTASDAPGIHFNIIKGAIS